MANWKENWKMKVEGNWNQLKGKVKEQWGDLTDDDVDVAEGEFDQLVGKIQKATGETKQNIESWFDKNFS